MTVRCVFLKLRRSWKVLREEINTCTWTSFWNFSPWPEVELEVRDGCNPDESDTRRRTRSIDLHLHILARHPNSKALYVADCRPAQNDPGFQVEAGAMPWAGHLLAAECAFR
jgi:hypothetical protein